MFGGEELIKQKRKSPEVAEKILGFIKAMEGDSDALGDIEDLKGGPAQIKWSNNSVGESDVSAFKDELAAAKEAWAKIQEESKDE